jgi:hypothetical protein
MYEKEEKMSSLDKNLLMGYFMRHPIQQTKHYVDTSSKYAKNEFFNNEKSSSLDITGN